MSVGDNVAYWIESGIGVKFQSRHVEQGKVIALDGDHLQIQSGSSGKGSFCSFLSSGIPPIASP